MHGSKSIYPILGDEVFKDNSDLLTEQCVVDPTLWLVDIELGWQDVVVPGENDGHTEFEKLRSVTRKALKPSQFIVKFGTRRGLPLGKQPTIMPPTAASI
jgi:hypothetical protein